MKSKSVRRVLYATHYDLSLALIIVIISIGASANGSLIMWQISTNLQKNIIYYTTVYIGCST